MQSKSRLLIIILLIALLYVPKSWAELVNITFIGHATVLIEDSNVRILTDPFFEQKILAGLKRRIPPACSVEDLPVINLVLISHTHPDHFDLEAIGKLKGNPIIVMPWGRKNELKKCALNTIELKPGEYYEKSGVKITAVTARHMYGHCLGYVIELSGQKIYFTGDTKLFNGIEKLRTQNIDLMLLPFDGTPVFGSIWTKADAAKAIAAVQPRIYVPIHCGTFSNWWTNKKPMQPQELIKAVKDKKVLSNGKILNVGEKLIM